MSTHDPGGRRMKTILLAVELAYNDEIMHSDDIEAKKWFRRDILDDGELRLHSEEIGDVIGAIKIVKFLSTSECQFLRIGKE